MAIEESGAPIAVAYVEVRADMTKYDASVRAAAGRPVPVTSQPLPPNRSQRGSGPMVFADPQTARAVRAEETRIVRNTRAIAQATEETARAEQRIADVTRVGSNAIDMGKARARSEEIIRNATLAAGGFGPGEIKIRGGGTIPGRPPGAVAFETMLVERAMGIVPSATAIRHGSIDYSRGATQPPPFGKSSWALSANAANAARAAETLDAMRWEKNTMNTFAPVPFKASKWAAASDAANRARAKATEEAMRWEKNTAGAGIPSQHWQTTQGLTSSQAGIAAEEAEWASTGKLAAMRKKLGLAAIDLPKGIKAIEDVGLFGRMWKGDWVTHVRRLTGYVARTAQWTGISRTLELASGIGRFLGSPGVLLAGALMTVVATARKFNENLTKAEKAASMSLERQRRKRIPATEFAFLQQELERASMPAAIYGAGPGSIAYQRKIERTRNAIALSSNPSAFAGSLLASNLGSRWEELTGIFSGTGPFARAAGRLVNTPGAQAWGTAANVIYYPLNKMMGAGWRPMGQNLDKDQLKQLGKMSYQMQADVMMGMGTGTTAYDVAARKAEVQFPWIKGTQTRGSIEAGQLGGDVGGMTLTAVSGNETEDVLLKKMNEVRDFLAAELHKLLDPQPALAGDYVDAMTGAPQGGPLYP